MPQIRLFHEMLSFNVFMSREYFFDNFQQLERFKMRDLTPKAALWSLVYTLRMT